MPGAPAAPVGPVGPTTVPSDEIVMFPLLRLNRMPGPLRIFLRVTMTLPEFCDTELNNWSPVDGVWITKLESVCEIPLACVGDVDVNVTFPLKFPEPTVGIA
jgi:hypothetical protein